MSNIFKFHRRSSKSSGAAWAYTLNGGNKVNVTTAQLTTWGMPTGTTDIIITNTGNITSDTTATPALTFASNLSGKNVTFINQGNIIGRGGNGGNSSMTGTAGNSGGLGISAASNVSIDNSSGIIGGGGGGGGGSQYGKINGSVTDSVLSGGGGGGLGGIIA